MHCVNSLVSWMVKPPVGRQRRDECVTRDALDLENESPVLGLYQGRGHTSWLL